MPQLTNRSRGLGLLPERTTKTRVFLGIDPGASGGIAMLAQDGSAVVWKMPETTQDLWTLLKSYGPMPITGFVNKNVFAVIEQQIPRPTNIFDRKTCAFRATILKSTCQLYGNYTQLLGMLVAAGIPFEECPPKRWQKALHIQPREKKETDSKWKNRLKSKAQSLFSQEGLRITLATADALLIATYCMRWREGKL